MPGFLELTLGGLLGSSLTAAVVGALFLRRNKRVESEIKAYFDERFKVFESTRSWKQQALFELLGPLHMQFDRTKRAMNRWRSKNLYLEANVVREGNRTCRDLLLSKGHLIPPHLMGHAGRLIEHYDAWLEAFEKHRGEAKSGDDVSFVFAGPDGFPFPSDAEEHFDAEFRKLQKELFGV